MKLLSLEIEKKIIATSQIIQHQKSLNYLSTSQNKNLEKIKYIKKGENNSIGIN